MNIENLARNFKERGFELYYVGGFLRDKILGRLPSDIDIATNASPADVILLAQDYNINFYDVGIKFGTVGLIIGESTLEITTFRSEQYPNENRWPEVTFGASLLEDLGRRDFTINAIAQNVLTKEIIDPFNGVRDIQDRLLTCVGVPAERFKEDPLRILRLFRFFAQMGPDWTPDIDTLKAAVNMKEKLTDISKERIAAEFVKIITVDDPSAALSLMASTGILRYIHSDFSQLLDPKMQNKYHTKPLWGHTLDVVAGVRPEPVLRLAAFLHDIGKSHTRSEDQTGIHFYNHEHVGAQMAKRILRDLKFSKDIVDSVYILVENHMRFNFYETSWKNSAIRKLMITMGNNTSFGIELSHSDKMSHKNGRSDVLYDLERRIKEIQDITLKNQLPINGNDIIKRYTYPPGPWIAKLKNYLNEELLEKPHMSEEDAWKLADQWVNTIYKSNLL